MARRSPVGRGPIEDCKDMEERVDHSPSASHPYRVSVRDLVRRPGTHREYSSDLVVPEDLGTEVIGIASGTAASLQVQVEVVTDGMWVDGTFSSRAVGECSRCLDEVAMDVAVTVRGLFLYPDATREEGEDSDDVYGFDGDSIELEEVVRDAVVTELPFIPLCDPNCQGLCDQCGARLADNHGHSHETLDPRWSALESVKASIQLVDKEES